MIHIAEASEAKGRVVVHLGAGTASTVAIDGAVWLARAFRFIIFLLRMSGRVFIQGGGGSKVWQ